MSGYRATLRNITSVSASDICTPASDRVAIVATGLVITSGRVAIVATGLVIIASWAGGVGAYIPKVCDNSATGLSVFYAFVVVNTLVTLPITFVSVFIGIASLTL